MTRYRDPNAPKGRVVFGGEAFIDGLTGDIDPGPGTLELFKGAGITPIDAEQSMTVDTEPDAVKPAPKPKK